MAEQKFKFPDEQSKEQETKDDITVEIIDDTPAQDRGRTPLPKEIAEELDKDDLEEYSDKVKKRMSQFKKQVHDERRAKEEADRQREEAIRFAQTQYEENRLLKQRYNAGEKIFKEEVTKSAASEVLSAKERLKAALEEGDSGKITDAQDSLLDAKMKLSDYAKFQPAPLQDEQTRVQHPQQTRASAQPPVDRKAEAWREKNTWFGAEEDMTALALGLHEKLVKAGVDPSSDNYYARIENEMNKRFPEYFQEEPSSTRSEESTTRSRRTSTVVAPATRSTGPRNVRLNASQAAIAKRLGITPEAYAREQLKLENSNG